MSLEHVDSLTDVREDILTEDERIRLRKIKAQLNKKPKPNVFRSIFQCNIFFYVLLIFIILFFSISVILSVTQLRTLEGNFPKCYVSPNEYRLPKSIQPKRYHIHLQTNFTHSKFQGKIIIEMFINEPTYCLYFHAKDLDINQISVQSPPIMYQNFEILTMKHNNKSDIVKVNFNHFFKVNYVYNLTITYTGNIRKDLEGWYESIYYDKRNENQKELIYTTHFECCGARTVFPAFDEPIFKSYFNLKIEHSKIDYEGKDQIVVSNTNARYIQEMSNGNRLYHFEETPIMSTYLIAFCIGKFNSISLYDSKGIERYAVYLSNSYDVIMDGTYSITIAKTITEKFNEIFNINYFNFISKLYMIGLPDFQAGAMENFGLITYRENYLINNLNTSSMSHIIKSSQVIAHEIAHQWVGNLITLKWWNDVYLNEGFATFFEYYILSKIQVNWNVMDTYFIGEFLPVLNLDCLPFSKSLSSSVNTINDIELKFDYISYNKGSIIIRMLYNYISENIFQEWIKSYLKEYIYKNVESNDLITHISTYTKINFEDKLYNWIYKAGYPIITIEKIKQNEFLFTQKRFLSFNNNNNNNDNTIWWIPIYYYTSKYSKEINIIEMNDVEMKYISNHDWFKLNSNYDTMIRINYPLYMWKKFISLIEISHPHLTIYDKLNLIDDAFAISIANQMNIEIPLEMSLHLSNINNNVIIKCISNHIIYISNILKDTSCDHQFNIYVQFFMKDLINTIGLYEINEKESPDIISMRNILYELILISENITIINTLIHQYENDLNNIPMNIKDIMLKILIAYGNDDIYIKLYNKYIETNDISYVYGLTQTRKPSLIKSILELTLSPLIRSQDGIFIIREISSNVYASEKVWDWVRQYFDDIIIKYGRQIIDNYMVVGITNKFKTSVKEREVYEFFKGKVAASSLKKATDYIKKNIHFMNFNYDKIKNWLEMNDYC